MICKYCGKPVSSGICTSCKKAVSLSYTSHELSDMLGLNVSEPLPPPPSIGQEQLQAAYEEGYSSGKKHGYSIGWEAAQKDARKKSMRKQRLLMIIAASAMVLLAVICSFAFNSIGFSRGYQQGKVVGKQEQKTDDETIIREKLKSERQDGYDEDYRIGYEEGILVTPSPTPSPSHSPTPSPTLSPTSAPIVLMLKSKGSVVRQLQQRLIELGFLAQNGVDGDYDPNTKKAIEEFQKKNGVTPVDGSSIVRQGLWNLIMSEDAIPMIPIPTPTVEVDSENTNLTPENESAPAELDTVTTAPGNLPPPASDDTATLKTTNIFDDDTDNGSPEAQEMDKE